MCIRDRKKAAELLIKAANLGGPQWLRSLAARLYTEMGRLQFGIFVLKEYEKGLPEGDYRKGIEDKIKALEQRLKQQ